MEQPTCKGCGSTLRTIEYQSRSADEAHSSVRRCPLCPLDITKFSNPIIEPHLYLKRSKRGWKKTPFVDSTVCVSSRLLCVTSKNMSLVNGCRTSTSMASNCIDKDSRLFKYYSTGPWRGLAVSHGETRKIGLNATVTSLSVLEPNLAPDLEYTDFKYTTMGDYTVMLLGNKLKLVFDLGTAPDRCVLEHLCNIYVLGFAPENLASYVTPMSLGAMSNANSKAYDAASANDNEDKFSTKPDGERMWLVRAGSTWLYCKRDYEVRSWEVDSTLSYENSHSVSSVIDVEFMLILNPILIDVLLGRDGKVCPYDRGLEWINAEMQHLREQFEYLSVVETRQFFSTYEEAQRYSKSVQYPTDGLVAIPPTGTDMKKLKPIKSIELKVNENQELTTREGNALFKLSGDSSHSPGDIVEVRFSLSDGNLRIQEVFYRPDKLVPNDNHAVQCVIASCNKQDSDSVLRTAMWRWSNKLRFYLYGQAGSMRADRNIILDIGSGSGQSTEAFGKADGCSFILVEPNEDACKSLSNRLGIRNIHKDPRSIIGLIPQLKRGVKKYHVLNCRLETILEDKVVVSNLKAILKCAVSCFSAHYVVGNIDEIVSLGIPFVGCYYSYEGVEVGESIVNTSGIQMTRTSHETALVKWGRDKAYNEPVVLLEDEPTNVTTVDALNVVPLESASSNTVMYRACSCVKVLISRH